MAQYSTPGVSGSGASGAAPSTSAPVSPGGASGVALYSWAEERGQSVNRREEPGGPSRQPRGAGSAASGERRRTLPFTGFLVIPLLIIGVALIVIGLVTRRLAARDVDRRPT